MPLCWDRFPPSVPRTPASNDSQRDGKSHFSAPKRERGVGRKTGRFWLVHTHCMQKDTQPHMQIVNSHMNTCTHPHIRPTTSLCADVCVCVCDKHDKHRKLYSIFFSTNPLKRPNPTLRQSVSQSCRLPCPSVALSPEHIHSHS